MATATTHIFISEFDPTRDDQNSIGMWTSSIVHRIALHRLLQVRSAVSLRCVPSLESLGQISQLALGRKLRIWKRCSINTNVRICV